MVAAIAVMVGILGAILLTTSTSGSFDEGSSQGAQSQVKSISIELEEVTILQVNERAAIIEIQFKLDNPNSRSVIVQMLQYSLYGSEDSEEYKITTGSIGSRPEGMVEFGSNYYTLLSNNSILLKDKIVIDYPGNSPELLSLLKGSNTNWRVEGVVFSNLSSMTSGQENETHFESRL